MKILLIAAIAWLCYSCTATPSAISRHLQNADSVVINLQTIKENDTAVKTFHTKDLKALQKLTHYLDAKPADNASCGLNGNMTFYSAARQIQAVEFNYNNPQCRRFAYTLNGALVNVQLTNEAADFFNALASGSDRY